MLIEQDFRVAIISSAKKLNFKYGYYLSVVLPYSRYVVAPILIVNYTLLAMLT